MAPPQNDDLGELGKLFFKLGVLGFGGPAAHIAMMEDEVVERRKWLSRQDFLDMVGATNLIPGPNSTEMAIHIGHTRGGWKGLVVAGTAFILPAVAITLGLAWLYVQYGTLPAAEPILAGVRPVVVAIVFAALWKLGGKALKTRLLIGIGLAVAAAIFLGANEVLALLAGGLLAIVLTPTPSADAGGAATGREGSDPEPPHGSAGPAPPHAGWAVPAALSAMASGAAGAAQVVGVSLTQLFLYFLTIGSVLYGSGYVLFAFLEGGLVNDLGWLTQQQLIDAVAIGQFTPGPVLSTATFVGYVVAGPMGAVLATVGMFLPSFVFVSLLARILPWLQSTPWLRAFLDGVNVSAVALMTVVTLRLSFTTFVSFEAVALALIAAIALVKFRLNAAFLIAAGAVTGWLFFSI